jgi:hypothetical protein
MARRVIPLLDQGWALDSEAAPLVIASPVEDLERLAKGLADGDLDVVLEGRRRLQNQMTVELQRLVGEFVLGVEAAETLYQKIGRAIALGRKLMESEPPPHYIKQCADPYEFVNLIHHATEGLVRFVAAEINHARSELGQPVMNPALVEATVRAAAQDLRDALVLASDDGVDRMAELAVNYARLFDTGADVEISRRREDGNR